MFYNHLEVQAGQHRNACIRSQRVLPAFLVTLSIVITGCGGGDLKPQLGQISGVITVDGKPVPDLQVTYEPQAEAGAKKGIVGGVSSGTTDGEGMFELRYKGGGVKGAVVGTHTVRIRSAGDFGPAGGVDAVPVVQIPAKYNDKTTLKAVVEPGENELNQFDLKSK